MCEKMNIMVLGASSAIGKSLVKSFANNNRLFLLSTKSKKLEDLKIEALSLGSKKVELIDCDLSSQIDAEKILNCDIDMFINIACSSSGLNNDHVIPSNHEFHTAVDLTSPLIIIESLLTKMVNRNDNSKLYIIFINTILSKIKSPGNSIYYSYKILQQEYIDGFRRKYGDTLQSINVIVGKQIDRTKETKQSVNLAKRIKSAIQNNDSEFIYGFEGKIIYFLYSISPIICNGLIYLKRIMQKRPL